MRRDWALCCAMLILTGCGDSQSAREAARSGPANPLTHVGMAMQSAPATDKRGAASPSVNLHRKVIYDAQITLLAKEFSTVELAIPKLVKQFGGYLANVSVNRTQGEQRSGRWQARIPVDQFDSFLDAVSLLGMLENRQQTTQDVTEEFVDLEARITNKKRMEERIVELLKTSSDKIKDVIEVERELARVRGEIEQMEGRLRYLTNRTELTTVTISASEVREYVPPVAPNFVDRIGQAWGHSLLSLKVLGENAAVALVYALPWLSVLGIAALPVWCVNKRNTRKAAANKIRP